MTEQQNEQQNEQPSVFITGYHETGLKLAFKFVLVTNDPINEAINFAKAMAAAQLQTNAVQVENENLDRIDISSVVLGVKRTDGKADVHRVWVYTDWSKQEFGSVMTVYLNNDTERAAFESATKLKIADLPLLTGARSGPTKDSNDYAKYFRATNFTIYRKQDAPKGDREHGTWKLIRYGNQAAGTTPASNGASSQPAQQPPSEELPARQTAPAVIAPPAAGSLPRYDYLLPMPEMAQWNIGAQLWPLVKATEYAINLKNPDFYATSDSVALALTTLGRQGFITDEASLPDVTQQLLHYAIVMSAVAAGQLPPAPVAS